MRKLTTQEWAIVTKHAHRVKAIVYHDSRRLIAQDVSEQLVSDPTARSPPNNYLPLLPNLATWEYDYDKHQDSDLFCLSSLAGSGLLEIHLTNRVEQPPMSVASPAALTKYLLEAPALYPYLQEFEIIGFTDEE